MWVYNKFIPQNAAPSNANKIAVYNSNGKKVGIVDLDSLALPSRGKKLYSFGAIADVHTFSDIAYTQDTTANDDFAKALRFLRENSDFTCIGGDLTCYGTTADWTNYTNLVEANAGDMPVYAIAGNHEYWYAERGETVDVANVIGTYTGHPLRYVITHAENPTIPETDVFIFCGCASSNDVFSSNSQIAWLEEQLLAYSDKRCFLFIHSFITGGEYCGDATGLYPNGDMYTDYAMQNRLQRTRLIAMLSQHKNVIFFHGHSHELFNTQEHTAGLISPLPANYDNALGNHSVHIPSLAIPIDVTSGSRVRVYGKSEGYLVDVYEEGIHLRGRDFVADEYIPIASYWLDTRL